MSGPLSVILPITPSQITRTREESLPPYVTEAFNELLRENLVGDEARFSQDAVVDSILTHAGRLLVPLSREDVFARHLLDVEEHYGNYGWKVQYVKRRIGDRDPSSFVFRVDPAFAKA